MWSNIRFFFYLFRSLSLEQIRNISFFFFSKWDATRYYSRDSLCSDYPIYTYPTDDYSAFRFRKSDGRKKFSLNFYGNLLLNGVCFFFNYFFNLYWKVVIIITTPLEIIIQIDNSKSIFNNQP